MTKPKDTSRKRQQPIDTVMKRRNFLSFATFIGLNAAAYGAWRWLRNAPVEPAGVTAGAQQPLRKALNKTELAFRHLFSSRHLVKTYPKEKAATQVRVNGKFGLKTSFDPQTWALQVHKTDGSILPVGLDDLRKLPKTELVFDFKCVEGWDQVQHWAGVRWIDFMEHYHLHDEAALAYAGLETPDHQYYVGIDMESALHPQTLLAYEMNGEALTSDHGAPLRLIIPVKYGIKNLKRIGSMSFSDARPRDYWAERGYDYYSGL